VLASKWEPELLRVLLAAVACAADFAAAVADAVVAANIVADSTDLYVVATDYAEQYVNAVADSIAKAWAKFPLKSKQMHLPQSPQGNLIRCSSAKW
jgi:hypothetical protein